MGSFDYNTVDLTVLGVLLLSGILAFRRGFVREIFSLGTWIAAAIVAAHYYPELTPWMKAHHLKNDLAAEAASAIALFCGTLIILIPVGIIAGDYVKGPTLSALNRSLGLVFGLLRGFLVLSIVFLCFMFIWPKDDTDLPEWLETARTRPLLTYGSELIKDFIPEDEKEKIADHVRKSREEAEKAVEDAERLKTISTPVPKVERSRDGSSPVYDGTSKEKMEEIIDRKSE